MFVCFAHKLPADCLQISQATTPCAGRTAFLSRSFRNWWVAFQDKSMGLYLIHILDTRPCMIPCHVGTCQRPKYAVKHTTPSSFRDLDFFKHHLSLWNHKNVFILKRIYPYISIYPIIIDIINIITWHHDVGKMNNYCKNKIKLITHFSRYSNLLEKQFRMVFTVF